MLMLPGVKSSKDVVKISCAYKTVQLELFFEGELTRSLLTGQLSLACRGKLHKCLLVNVFGCLNNLLLKYLIQYFTRNRAFHDRVTRSINLHPPKPKHKMERRTLIM